MMRILGAMLRIWVVLLASAAKTHAFSLGGGFQRNLAMARSTPGVCERCGPNPRTSVVMSLETRTTIAEEDVNVIDKNIRTEDTIEYASQGVNFKIDPKTIFASGIVVALIALGISNQVVLEESALKLWDSYSAILSTSPVQTKAVTSATVYTIGDFIAQRTEGIESLEDLDRPRLARSLLAGLIGHGPLSHVWYEVSENLFQNVLHLPNDFFGTAAKVVIDQTTWGPFWNNTYILMLGLMKLDSFETIFSEMKRTTIPLIVSGLKLWPLAHCVTYGLVPVENRLLWVDVVEIVWVTILATTAAGKTQASKEQQAKLQ